jgi:EAL domain-containing protein (putative c-di-GMP-specific phosphodiesterase class I)/DNA-binding NarL/FixJ family response regulator
VSATERIRCAPPRAFRASPFSAEPMTTHSAEVMAMPVRSLRFLIVDDDADQRFLLSGTLARMGMTNVVEAASGRAALDLLGRDDAAFDIAITDLHMPDVDGMALVRRIGQRRLPVAVVLVTSLGGDLLQTAAAMTEAYGVRLIGTLVKPATKDKLFDIFTRYRAHEAAPAAGSAAAFAPTSAEVLNGFAAAQFVPHFQAIEDIATGMIVGAEALARWDHPVHGVVGPELFLPPLARAGYLDELSWIMLALSAMEARSWQDAGLRTKVSVNVSATSLADPGYADSVTEIVSGHGIEPSQMTLELTETEAIMNVAEALENVTRLRMKGFGLAVDDFGVGYSSMHELSRMPFTELKIDRAFVTAAQVDERPRLLIEQTVAIARRLGLKTVAEGVERRAERDMLQRLGCDWIQGYLVAKPMDGRKFLEWMLERRAGIRADGTAPAPDAARFGT